MPQNIVIFIIIFTNIFGSYSIPQLQRLITNLKLILVVVVLKKRSKVILIFVLQCVNSKI
jgi:hypothetical protein